MDGDEPELEIASLWHVACLGCRWLQLGRATLRDSNRDQTTADRSPNRNRDPNSHADLDIDAVAYDYPHRDHHANRLFHADSHRY